MAICVYTTAVSAAYLLHTTVKCKMSNSNETLLKVTRHKSIPFHNLDTGSACPLAASLIARKCFVQDT